MRMLISVSLLLLYPLAAQAQVTVIGDGLASTCFKSVKYGNGNYRDNVETCTRALEQTPLKLENRLATFVNRGILHMRNGKYDDSIRDFDTAIRIRPEMGVAWLNKGAALIYQKQDDAALEALNKAIEFETKDLHAAYFNRSIIMERRGDYTSAYWDLRQALDLKPDFQQALDQINRYDVQPVSGPS